MRGDVTRERLLRGGGVESVKDGPLWRPHTGTRDHVF